jgi:thiol-disulfide isomerase/thioredoxin
MTRRTRRTPVLAAPRAVLPVGLLVVGLLAGCSSSLTSSGAPDKGFLDADGTITKVAADDRRAPVTFRGTTLEGKPFDLAAYRGKVVVVNVWASWCGPCIKEAPALERVWTQVHGLGVQFVGVDTRDQNAAARAHQRRFGVTYPSVDDDSGRVLLALRGILPPKAPPSTLVLDRRGRVAYRVLESLTTATLRDIIDDALAERPAAAAGP